MGSPFTPHFLREARRSSRLCRCKPTFSIPSRQTHSDRSTSFSPAGNDGQRPGADKYEGQSDPAATTKSGLVAFEDIDEIAIVCCTGIYIRLRGWIPRRRQHDFELADRPRGAHALSNRVLDSGDGESIADVRALRSKYDSTYAALYYPWVTILDPVTRKEVNLPPVGICHRDLCPERHPPRRIQGARK